MKAKYTMLLKDIMDDSEGKQLLNKALSTYPMYEPKHPANYSIIPTREQINTKLLNHYKYREIGFETPGRFLDELEITMNEIMPYYYQLFKSEDIMNDIKDPFGNVDITETFEQETEGSSKGSSSSQSTNQTESSSNSNTDTDMTNNTKNISSKTPQGLLDIGTKDIDSVGYGDNATWNEDISNSKGNTEETGSATSESSGSGQSSNETSGTTKHTLTRVGNQGVNTYAHDMKELREIFLNIEQQIITDPRIAELFMLVY